MLYLSLAIGFPGWNYENHQHFYGSWIFNVTKNKCIEVEESKRPHIFAFEIGWTTAQDHAGLRASLCLFGREIEINFYDRRHYYQGHGFLEWDEAVKRGLEKPTPPKHPRTLSWMEPEEAGEALGNMHYQALAMTMYSLHEKLNQDSAKDLERGRRKLAMQLAMASGEAKELFLRMDKVWQICKPHMKEQEDVKAGNNVADGDKKNHQ